MLKDSPTRQPERDASEPKLPIVRGTRKWFLALLAGGAALVAAVLRLGLGGPRGGGSSRSLGGLGSDWPVLSVEREPPHVPAEQWVIEVDGLVENPLRIDHVHWVTLPRLHETDDFHCVEGWSVDGVGWEGVSPGVLLREARPLSQAAFVTFHAYGGTYADSLTLAEAFSSEALLADTLDGRPLPPPHGGPIRLVIPSQLGYKNVKWVVRLEVTKQRALGYWEERGYPAEAPI